MKLSTVVKSVTLGSILVLSVSAAQAMKLEAKDVDLNSDGKVTEAEILHVVKTHFMKMDKNNDHVVTTKEWYPGNDTMK